MKLKIISLLVLVVFSFGSDKIDLNFQNLSLENFIKMIAKISDKNVLMTKHLTGKVNFISVKPIDKKELWNILLNVLKSRGYTIVENGGFLQVVSLSEAVKLASLTKSKGTIPQISTEIIYLKHISPEKLKSQISSFLSNSGRIVIPKEGKFIILTDFPRNIKIIKSLIKKLDYKQSKTLAFVKLNNANASFVVKKAEDILKEIMPSDSYKLFPNNDADNIVVIAPDKYIYKIKTLLKKFDIPKSQTTTAIIKLKNTDVLEISKILDSIIKEKFTKNKPSVTSDTENNSLILVGLKEQINILKTIIEALDVPKKQVYVKIKILELSNSKVANIGTQLGILGGSASSSGLYTMSANLGGPAVAFNPASLGLSVPTVTKGLALGATFNLLETTGAAKKLSEPSILCVNNTPSSIYIGKTVSVITQSTVGATSTDLTKNNYSRQDIGLKMKIKPRIDTDNKVAIKIDGIIEDILPGSQMGLPITSKRQISTTAIVQNGQSIIIGGLIRNNSDLTVSKVPFLGDIPILGALFRNKQARKDQTTIVIVLTPYIVNNTDELGKLKTLLVKLNVLQTKFVDKIIKKKKIKNVEKK